MKFILAVAACALALSPAGAQIMRSLPEETEALRSLDRKDIRPAELLPPPAQPGTAAHTAEVAEIVAIQAAASPERKAQAIWDDRHEDPSLFAATLGPGFDLARLPATARLLGIIQNDADIAAGLSKVHFARKRPWFYDERIEVCEEGGRSRTPERSYPSGHSTVGYALALTLAHLRPDLAPRIMARGQDFAFSRMVCGVHYRSDTTAALAIAMMATQSILHDPRLARLIAAAKAEMGKLPA